MDFKKNHDLLSNICFNQIFVYKWRHEFRRALQLFRGIYNSFKRQTHVKNVFRVMQGIWNDFCHFKINFFYTSQLEMHERFYRCISRKGI